MLTNIIIICLLTLCNAFFAMAEIAFISLNDAKIEKMAEEGNKKAKKIQKMLKDPSKFLATIQIGITLAGFLASAFAADTFADELAPYLSFVPLEQSTIYRISMILITIILSYFTLVLGELVPKKIAMKYYEKISFGVVGIINAIAVITKPFVYFLSSSTNLIARLFGITGNEESTITEEEIKMMIDVGEEKGTINEQEKEMIHNVFDFNDKTAEEVMVPRIDVIAIDIAISNKEAVDIINQNKFSRIPVYEGNIDNILGTLHVRDLISYLYNEDNIDIRSIIRQPIFIPASKKIHKVFAELQAKKQSIGIVVDEYGGTAGIVTIEDLVEEIVGEITDEFDDDEELYEKLDDNTYIVDGSMKIYEAEKLFETEIADNDNDTISGLLLEKIGGFPKKDSDMNIEIGSLSFSIFEYNDKKITKIKICKNEEEIIE